MVVGVIPAAGYARRLRPSGMSKEVLRIAGLPVIDYLVDRMRAAGCDLLKVVTRPEKVDVIRHARSLGADVVLGHPASVSESISAGLASLEPQDVVLLGFPDTIWEPRDGFARLLDAVAGGSQVALGAFKAREPGRSDVIEFESGLLRAVKVKPGIAEWDWIWGCFAARTHSLHGVADYDEPGVYFDRLCKELDIAVVELSEMFVDIGTLESWQRFSALSYEEMLQVARYS